MRFDFNHILITYSVPIILLRTLYTSSIAFTPFTYGDAI